MRSFSLAARAGRYVKGIVATDIVSSLATSPFSLFHFNRAANFGLVANSVSIPLMGFWVMPLAIVALALMPFGLDGPVWRAAASGVDAMLSLGAFTAGLPGAVTVFPKWPDAVLPVFAVGGLWLCLMTGVWRLAGLLALPLAAVLIAGHRAPDIYVSASGENAAAIVRSEAGEALVVFDPRKDRFAARAFLEHAGLDERKDKPEPMRRDGFCDREGCVVPINGASVAFSNQRHTLDDDCARAALVIALFPVSQRERQGCAAALIDRRDVWEEGAHSARVAGPGQTVIGSVKDRRGERAWARY
ncbi:MAG: ComEC/Rec2 family competence protein [Parvularculaceae bacterium]